MGARPLEKKSQTELLKDHFAVKSSISSIEAAAQFRIRSLSRRINDLEVEGWEFHREQKTDPTGQRYVRYVHVPYVAPITGRQFADR